MSSSEEHRREVHLVDASPYIFRAWFALPDTLRTPDGRPVNAVYGFLTFLVQYLREQRPTHLALAFDESLTTSFRNDLYPEYKAQRGLPPAELEAQLADCQAVGAALGCATFAHERYEADDLIATLAHGLQAQGHGGLVVTIDKDLCQLVDDDFELFDVVKDRRYDAAAVVDRWGVRPAQIPDYLGLAGDSVDNIPGVPGVGAKTAAALLASYPDLDAVYADLPGVGQLPIRGARRLAGKLAEHREVAFLSRELATVARDAPLQAGLADLAWQGARRELVEPLFERLGFERVRERIPKWA